MTSDSNTPTLNKQVSKEATHELEVAPSLERVPTLQVDNYHGIKLATVLVYASLALIVAAQVMNLVGAGVLSRDIAAVVGGSTQYIWLIQSIAILTCVLGPPLSQAADYWGRKWFIVITTLFGFIGGLVVAKATSMGMAIAGEVICGVAYGAQPLVYSVASEIFPRRYRPAAQGGINLALGLGGIFALLTGSALTKSFHEGFRTFWYIVSGILGLSAILFAVLYAPPPRELQVNLTQMEKVRKLDWIGFAFLTSGIILFTMGLSWAQNPYRWTDPKVLAPLLLGALLLICLTAYEIWLEKAGMFHHDLFSRDRNFAIALGCFFVDGIIFFAVNGYFALEVSLLWETDPVRIGLRFCMLFFAAMVGAFAVSIYSSMTKDIRSPSVGFFLLSLIFFVGMATASFGSSKSVWVYMTILGFATGLGLTCLVTAAQLSAPPHLIAITSGLMFSVRSLGGSIALAIYNAIFSSSLQNNLGHNIASAIVPLGVAPESVPSFIGALNANNQTALQLIPGVLPVTIGAGFLALQESYIVALRGVWICAAGLSFLAAIAACFLINPYKDLTMHVDAPLQDD